MKQTVLLARLFALCVAVLAVGCTLAPTSSQDRQITLELSSYPARLSANDSTATAEVWATIRRGGKQVADSTLVVFATTAGEITPASLTRDGLAIAFLTSPGDGRPQRAEIIAQALTVRDTLEIDFVIIE